MASLYKRTHRKPAPVGAAITKSWKPIPAGAVVTDGVAVWNDRTGCQRSGIVSGDQVQTLFATITTGRGQSQSLPLDHTGGWTLTADRNYMASYTDASGARIRKSTKTTDKATAQRIANKWESDARLRETGVIDELAEKLAMHAARPIEEHIAAFIQFRASKGGTEKHRARTKRHIEEFREAGGWRRITEIDADAVTKHVGEMMSRNAAARTIQSKLQSIKSFTKWLADHHRLHINPLSMVRKPDPNADRRHERRMLLPDEWQWIVTALNQQPFDRNSMSASERILLYQTAIQTGLRATELAELPRNKLILLRGTPHVLCGSAGTKNRKPARQFLDFNLANQLKDHVATKHPTASVFGIGSKEELSRGLQIDLAAARKLWLRSFSDEQERIEADASDFLQRTNHEGAHLVFHSLRHTCGAWLAMSGAHVKTVQTIMRHGSITLTMDRYGHLFPGEAEGAAARIAAMLCKPGQHPHLPASD
ncbi:tyrosine-type recombinase/integrase [Rhodopirellula europaea]|uniref:tyrosine-type recombinase/integrase n=1 Tax=Rhodopirellula europaea TaxID=1263866 RepID=UPI0011817CE0|nr:site-specific integrase [Rhodopirellula europaea]